MKLVNAYQKGLDRAKEWGLDIEYTDTLLRLLMEFDFNGNIEMAVNLALVEWDIYPILDEGGNYEKI